MYINFNGTITKAEEAMLPLDTEGMYYGYGLFETVKVKEGKIHHFQEHLERMKEALKKLKMTPIPDDSFIKKQCTQLIEKNNVPTGALKIMATKNKEKTDLVISLRQQRYTNKDYEVGFKLTTSSVKRNPYSLLTYIKSINYLENIIARKEAIEKGYHEVVITNIYNKICEGSISNIFFVKDKIIYTPKESCGLLPGVMRRKVIDLIAELGLKMVIDQFVLEDLVNSQEIFITNSLMDIMPVSQIVNRKLDLSKNYITQQLRQKYDKITKEI